MENPLNISKKNFINNPNEDLSNLPKQKVFRTTFSLNEDDFELLNSQIDRSIKLNKRTKSKTCIMRMALEALQSISDEKYLELYNKY